MLTGGLWQRQFVINPMRRKRRFDKPIFYWNCWIRLFKSNLMFDDGKVGRNHRVF